VLKSSSFIGALACALAPFAANAQVYTSSQFPAPFVPVTNGAVQSFGSPDDSAVVVPLGFTFEYFSVNYTHIYVMTNGYAVLATPCTNNNQCGTFGFCDAGFCDEFASTGAPGPFPDVDAPNSIFGPFWDDLYIQSGSQIMTATEGSAPNRVFVIEWRNIGHYPSGTAGTMNFQVRVAESGTVRLAWGSGTVGANTWNGDIGVESADGMIGFAPNLACVSIGAACTFADFSTLTNQVFEIGPVDGPELVALVNPPPGADPGAQIRVGVTARNIGTQTTTAAITAEVYLSVDTTITPGVDTRLGSVSIPRIPSRDARTATLTTTLPAMLLPGRYRIGAIVDTTNVIREASEGNNTAVSGEFLVGPDVSVTVRAPTSAGPGEALRVPLTIASVGSPLPGVFYRVYLSADATLDAGDLLVTTGTAAINGQASLAFDATGILPINIQPASYYAIAVLDPLNRIIELDEMNNSGVTTATFRVIGPDLAVTEVTVVDVAYRGQPFTVSGTIRNVGGATARDFTYTIYLSDNQLVTATDPVLCEFGPISMAPNETLNLVHTCTVSATAQLGTNYVGVIADSNTVVLEEDERDNIRFRRPAIQIRDPSPDFTVGELTAAPLGAVGESLAIGRIIDNLGNAPGSVEYGIYLSRDATINAMADVEIGRGMATLRAGTRQSGVDQARIPSNVMPGAYYLGYIIDPAAAVAELDETNNIAVTSMAVTIDPGQLTILTRELPQGTVGLPYQLDLAASGGTGQYVWSIVSGELPPGLALDGTTGRISGSPTRPADVRVGLQVTDGASRTNVELRLLVAESTIDLDIITRAVPPAFVGRPYEFPLTAIGGIPPYVWTSQGVLPAGLVLSPQGVLTGVGTAVGPSTVTFRVSDVAGTLVERPITVRVIASDDALRFTSDILRDGVVGRMYEDRFRAENGQAPYTFALLEGDLPGGVVFEDDKLTGTPTVAGTYSIAVRVNDSRGDFDTNRFVITIDETDDGVRFVTNSLPAVLRGENYLEEGGTPVRLKAISPAVVGDVRYVILAGDLPQGLTLNANGEIRGAPMVSGVFPFTAEARDSAGQSDHRALAIVVEEPPMDPIIVPDPGGCGCTTGDPSSSGAMMLLVVGLALGLRRRKRALLAAILIGGVTATLAPERAEAQAAIPYFLREEAAAYVPRTGGTVLTFSSQDDDDAPVTLPFPFRYFGTNYTDMSVGTNGFVAFNQGATQLGNTAFPTSGTPNNMIAVFWDDLFVNSVRTVLEGTAPSRIMIVQWDAVRLGQTDPILIQLWLYEGLAGRFEARYGSMGGANLTASIGFENDTGSVGYSWRTCSPACTGMDLAALNGTVLRALQDGGTDVTANSIVIPPRTFAGAPFTVEATISSIHQNPIGPFTYGYLLLPASGMGSGTPIFQSMPVTLAAYQTLNVRDDVTIPVLTPPGRYRLALVVDDTSAIMEPDETNNLIVSRTEIVVGERHPDFTATRIVATPAQTMPGATVQVVVDLANVGNLDGAADWRLVMSANRVISADDTVVHNGNVSLALQTSRTATVPVTLASDLAPGRYFFGVVFDPEDRVVELSEVNNAVAARNPIEVGVDFADVATEMLPGGYVGVLYSAFLRGAGGDGTYAWEIASGTLPAGLSLVPTSGEILGTPTAAGDVAITVRVTSAGRTAEQMLNIEIRDRTGPLTIVTQSLVPAVVGQSYPPSEGGELQRIRTVNASGDVVFRLVGSLPSGLDLTADGILQGVPLNRGVFDVVVEARDATTTATRSIPLTVVEPGRLAIVAASLPGAVLDEEYRFQLQAIGATSTVTFSTSEVLPDGVTLTTAGLIVGVPTRAGTWRFSVQVSEGAPRDPNYAVDDANFSLTVGGGDGFGITPSSLPVAEINKPYEAVLEARGGTPPFTWSLQLQSQQLPRGIRFEVEQGTGGRHHLRFLGTPEALIPGSQAVSFLATVEDIAGRRAEQPLAIRVVPAAAPVVVNPTPAPGGCTTAASGATSLVEVGILAALIGLIRSRRRIKEM